MKRKREASGKCVYVQVKVQMYLKGWDSVWLSKETGITYSTMRRKLRGDTPITLEEAMTIRDALNKSMTLDQMFARRKEEKE